MSGICTRLSETPFLTACLMIDVITVVFSFLTAFYLAMSQPHYAPPDGDRLNLIAAYTILVGLYYFGEGVLVATGIVSFVFLLHSVSMLVKHEHLPKWLACIKGVAILDYKLSLPREQPDNKSDSKSSTNTKTDTEPNSLTEPKAETEPEAKTEPEADTESKVDTELTADTALEDDTESKAETTPKADNEPVDSPDKKIAE